VSEEKEGLKEKALRAYKEYLERERKIREKKARDIAGRAREEFIQRFETEPEETVPISPYECLLKSDGLKFRAVEDGHKIRLFVFTECQCCHSLFEKRVTSLRALGEVLSETCICEKCKEAFGAIAEGTSREEEIIKKLCEVLKMLRDYDMDCD